MRIILGLGNPGAKYAGNRHNIGWHALDALARRWNIDPAAWRVDTEVAAVSARPCGLAEEVWLVKPQRFMNRSGEALQSWWRGRSGRRGLFSAVRDALSSWLGTASHEAQAECCGGGCQAGCGHAPDWSGLLAVVDDVNLAPGRLRLRAGGADGGHNGLADLTRVLGTEQYPRLRIGVGTCPPGMDLKDWVLGDFADDERDAMASAALRAAEAAECWLLEGLVAAQSRFNGSGTAAAALGEDGINQASR